MIPRIVLLVALLASSSASAQGSRPAWSEPLRPDGNGIAVLRRALGVNIDTTSVAIALQAVARRAGLTLAVDSQLPGLARPAALPASSGTVAEAVLVVLSGTPIAARVSTAGEVVLAPRPASRERVGAIRGRVVDGASVPIAGALVTMSPARVSVATDSGGRFGTTGLAEGAATMRVHAFGHADLVRVVMIPPGATLDLVVRMRAAAAQLAPMRTEARTDRQVRFEDRPSVSVTSIVTRDVLGVPGAVQADVMRTVQLLPGVSARNDYSASLNVRGGESEQNLMLLDGYPIYNPFHLGGLFSTFIPSTVGQVSLLSGGFPATYGDRLSSVLDVRSSEEERDGTHGSADVSLLSASATTRGTFGRSAGIWMLAARRTYADAFINTFKPDAFPYHFRDLQAHASHTAPGGMTVAATLYTGEDVIAPHGSPDAFTFGNLVLGATLAKSFADVRALNADSVVVTQRVSRSRFRTEARIPTVGMSLRADADERRLAGTVTVHGVTHDRAVGYELSAQQYDYGSSVIVPILPVDSLNQRATRASVFYDDLWRVRPTLLIEGGVRADLPSPGQPMMLSPRFSAKYFLTPDLALTGAVGRYTQSVHSLGREDVPLRLADFWTTSDSVVPVSTAMHYIAGVERRIGSTRTLRLEGYLKSYEQLVEPNPLSDPRVPGDEFLATSGRSWGVDVLAQQFGEGRFTGWLAYSFAVSTRRQPDGLVYHPGQDRRHDVNLVGSWRGDAWTIGTRFGFATGTPYTAALGDYDRSEYDPTSRQLTSGAGLRTLFLMGPRDAERLPPAHRLDLSVTRNGRLFGASVSPYLSVANVYNARNAFAYFYEYRQSPPTRTPAPQFPILPSVGVAIAW